MQIVFNRPMLSDSIRNFFWIFITQRCNVVSGFFGCLTSCNDGSFGCYANYRLESDKIVFKHVLHNVSIADNNAISLLMPSMSLIRC